jgi:type VI secretion system secreted protein Hcp
MAVYLEWNKGEIKGDTTQGKHTDWISINSFQFGTGRGISTAVGAANNREASEPSLSEVVVTKDLDASSLMLFQEATTGKDGKDVEIDFCTTDNEGAPYLVIKLTNCLISGFSTSSGGDRPSESITLNFTKIDINETGGNLKNGAGNPIKVSYDLAKASK